MVEFLWAVLNIVTFLYVIPINITDGTFWHDYERGRRPSEFSLNMRIFSS